MSCRLALPLYLWATSATMLLLAGCGGSTMQSALHPAGPAAAKIAWLWWIMCGAFTAVMVLVVLLTLWAIFRRLPTERSQPPLGRTGFIVAGGIVLPVATVVPLMFLSLETSAALRQPRDALTVRVVGAQWWWAVAYPDQNIVTANEIHIPVGEPVRLELTSADVIHSFWVPSLNGKRDMVPGIKNEFWIQADRPGIYRGQCGEYCGTQHANMAFVVVALAKDEFDDWVDQRQRAAAQVANAEPAAGLQIFLKAGCAKCHTIRGTAANGTMGPDLTHLGSRRTLGAGLLPNTPGGLSGWIANPKALKPGVHMPANYLAADDLLALVAYLESLK